MKYFILGILIMTSALASECYQYEAKGMVRTKKLEMSYVVNEGTMSQFVFSVPTTEVHKFAPYIDVTSVATLVFKNKPQSKDSILKIEKVERGNPDPLNPMKHTYLKELGKMKCP